MRTGIFGLWKFLTKKYNTWRGGCKVGRYGKMGGDFQAQGLQGCPSFSSICENHNWGGETGVQRKNTRLYQLDWSAAQSPLALTPRGAACMYFMDVRKGHSPLRTRAANLNLQSGGCRNYIFTLDWCTRIVEWMIPFICGPYYHFNAELPDFGTVKL